MNSDALLKTKAKYEPKFGITITLNVHTTKDPEKIAQMIEQRAFTIDGVEFVACPRSEIYELVAL